MSSKRTQIMAYVKDTVLPRIKTASGYNFNLSTIHRGLRRIENEPESNFPVVYLPSVDEDFDNITVVDFKSKMDVIVVGYVKNPAGLDGLQEDMDKLIEDIRKAFEQDRLLGGGLGVYKLEIKSLKTDDGDLDPIGGISMRVEIWYAARGTTP